MLFISRLYLTSDSDNEFYCDRRLKAYWFGQFTQLETRLKVYCSPPATSPPYIPDKQRKLWFITKENLSSPLLALLGIISGLHFYVFPIYSFLTCTFISFQFYCPVPRTTRTIAQKFFKLGSSSIQQHQRGQKFR
jgi:hypothetical protein